MKSFLFSALVATGIATGAFAAAPPNFILILTDDQGWPMMNERMHPDMPESRVAGVITPAMDRLAREGMRFTSG